MAKALVVDDEADVREAVVALLAAEGLETVEAEDGESALDLVQRERPDIVLLDLGLPGLDGMAVLRRARVVDPDLTVVMLTGVSDVRVAVEAMQLGAVDYLTKPFMALDLRLRVRRALERRSLLAEIDTLKSELAHGRSLAALMGTSRPIQEVIHRVRQVAGSDFTVLIQGETGTGKELVARAIHHESRRRDKPFIALDCGAIPDTLIESELFGYEKGAFTGADRRKDGHFQLADGGTLFLDEVANLPLPVQGKLLRALQERTVWPLGARTPAVVDVRIIAACNVSLEGETRSGAFRRDLYYRLNEFEITLPPLRVRRDDIMPLATRFLEEACVELKRTACGFSDEAGCRLLDHDWPGNVRELRNVVRRAVLVSGDLVTPADLGALGSDGGVTAAGSTELPLGTLKAARDRGAAEAEERAIRAALAAAHGNKSEAARLLKTDFKTLHGKMKQFGIGLTDRRPS
jgi:two-component system nitrogen regulation response regulator GlnG